MLVLLSPRCPHRSTLLYPTADVVRLTFFQSSLENILHAGHILRVAADELIGFGGYAAVHRFGAAPHIYGYPGHYLAVPTAAGAAKRAAGCIKPADKHVRF